MSNNNNSNYSHQNLNLNDKKDPKSKFIRNKSQKISNSKNNKKNKNFNFEEEYYNLSYKNRPKIKEPNFKNIKISNLTKIKNEDFKIKFKTEICHFYEINGYCKFGENCSFAHGEAELKSRKLSFNYKTKLCIQFFEFGYCPYGIRCQFSHKKENYNVSYLKILNDINDEKINQDLLSKRRLLTFENLVYFDLEKIKENRILLYEDLKNAKKENEKINLI